MHTLLKCAAVIATGLAAGTHAQAQSINVTEPSSNVRVAEGRDYATWDLGNRWGMHCPDWSGQSKDPGDPIWDGRFTCDLVTSENRNVTSELFSNSTYSATSATADPNLIYVSPGPVAGVGLSNGRIFPIKTGTYRHFTVKVRTTNTGSNHGSMVFFFTSADSNDPFGRAGFKTLQHDGWQILTFDMIEDINIGEPANATLHWDDQEEVIGFRYDPVPNQNINFEIDWARLTTDPGHAAAPDSTYLVEWDASGISDTFTITAQDADGARLVLAEGLSSGTRSATVDFSRLAPGSYNVEVAAGSTSDLAPGNVVVNHAPEVHVTEPDKRGDESRDYALDELGNAWGPMDTADIVTDNTNQTNLQNIQFVSGDLEADAPTGGESPGDPRMTFETPATIDTGLYRMLTYTFDLDFTSGEIGSVARIHWGTNTGPDPTPDTVTDDIRIRQGFNTYVLGDMREVPDKDGIKNVWNGDLTVLRFDPHEMDETRAIVFREMRVRPLDTADPDFLITWDMADPDTGDPLTLTLFYDEDRNPDNGNETVIASGLDARSTSSHLWNAADVPTAEYFILAEVTDGHNSVRRYATGPISVVSSLVFKDGFQGN